MELLAISKLIQKQQFAEASLAARTYLNDKGICVDGLNLLGVTYTQLNQLKEAKTAFENAVNHYPNHFKSNLNLALTMISLNNFGAAKVLLEKCNQLSKDNPEVLSSLGNLCRIEGELSESEQYLNKAALLAPNNPQIAENKAWLLLAQKKYDDACHLFKRLVQAFPDRLEYAIGLAESSIYTKQWKQADTILRYLKQKPKSLEKTYYLLSKLEKHKGHQQKSLDWLNKALSIEPNDAKLLQAIVQSNIEFGNKEAATGLILDLIERGSKWTEAYFILLYFCSQKLNQKQEQSLYQLLSEQPKCHWLNFAAAKHYENKHMLCESANYLIKARECFAVLGEPASVDRPFSELIKNIETPKDSSPSNIKMIFITGMPRSGTTLVDQILDSHPKVKSIGESGLVAKLALKVQKLTNKPYYMGVKQLTAEQKNDLLEACYLEFPCQTGTIVDTTPNNIFYVSFILSFWPDSKIILCRRSPKDTCLSIFQHPLRGQNYANSQASLSSFFSEVNTLTESYVQKLSNSCFEVIYENLVNSPEQLIYDFLLKLDLPLSTSCLSPELNKRAVHTPSSTQVRQAINTTSIGKHKRFEPYLVELFQPLEALERLHQHKISKSG